MVLAHDCNLAVIVAACVALVLEHDALRWAQQAFCGAFMARFTFD